MKLEGRIRIESIISLQEDVKNISINYKQYIANWMRQRLLDGKFPMFNKAYCEILYGEDGISPVALPMEIIKV